MAQELKKGDLGRLRRMTRQLRTDRGPIEAARVHPRLYPGKKLSPRVFEPPRPGMQKKDAWKWRLAVNAAENGPPPVAPVGRPPSVEAQRAHLAAARRHPRLWRGRRTPPFILMPPKPSDGKKASGRWRMAAKLAEKRSEEEGS